MKYKSNKTAAYRRQCVRQYNIDECKRDARLQAMERQARADYHYARLLVIHARHQAAAKSAQRDDNPN